MRRIVSRIRRIVRAQDGVTMVEYALMLALIAVVCLVAVTQVGTGTKAPYNSVSASL